MEGRDGPRMEGATQRRQGLAYGLTSARFRRRLDELCAERADVRLTRLLLGDLRFLEWAHAIGATTDPALRDLVPPLPPLEMRRIVSDWQPEMFLWTGYLDACAVLDAAERHGAPAASVDILDFGAGCGRTTRFFATAPEVFRACAAEINPATAAWCERNLRTVRATPSPPLPFPTQAFDIVYAISVFTHLDRAASEAWLGECARVLRPGGLLVATVHGANVLERIGADATLQLWFRMPPDVAARVLRETEAAGFVYRRYDADVLRDARAGDEYGLTFVSPEGLAALPSRGLRVVEHRLAGQRGWQDLVVWRREKA